MDVCREQLMKLTVLLAALAIASVAANSASAQAVEMRKNGNITSFETKDNLAASRMLGCISIAEAKNDFTPPDLFQSLIACVQREDYESAGSLYYLARIYAAFDSLRVADNTAGQAGSVLMMQTWDAMPDDRRDRLSQRLDKVMATPDLEQKLCGDLQKVGMPTYRPTYMISHGMGAFLGGAAGGELVKDFDGASEWNKLLGRLKNCPR
jgi:hypothetical protein